MIKIVAKMTVKEGCLETFKATAKELVEKSAAEAGNIFYTLNVSAGDPNQIAIIECWKDQAAIDFHNHTEHFTTILPKLGALCKEGGNAVEFYQEVEF